MDCLVSPYWPKFLLQYTIIERKVFQLQCLSISTLDHARVANAALFLQFSLHIFSTTWISVSWCKTWHKYRSLLWKSHQWCARYSLPMTSKKAYDPPFMPLRNFLKWKLCHKPSFSINFLAMISFLVWWHLFQSHEITSNDHRQTVTVLSTQPLWLGIYLYLYFSALRWPEHCFMYQWPESIFGLWAKS